MKNYVYLIQDENNKVVAAYSDNTVATKMLTVLEKGLDTKLIVSKQLIDADITVLLNGAKK